MTRSVKAEVISSTFDEPPNVTFVAGRNGHRTRKAAGGAQQDVVILLDSITRLARAHNTVAPHSGRILSGGVDSQALYKQNGFSARRATSTTRQPYHYRDGAHRNGSRMDEVIFEEFKGTGNMNLCSTGKSPTGEFIPPSIS